MKNNQVFLGICIAILLSGCASQDEIVPDFCPDNPNKTAPGLCGCDKDETLDENNNGTPDCLETNTGVCPAGSLKTEPGVCGCETPDTDTDNDGYPDCIDKCIDDPNKVVPGICGCHEDDTIDANGNLIPDCKEDSADLCPTDPDKTEPGLCGCEVPDKDADNDGTPDCLDLCPTDPAKIKPGICNCETPDADTDNDGIYDCFDECPQDPTKVFKGLCGCMTPDSAENIVDSDGDGVINCLDACPNNPIKSAEGSTGSGCEYGDLDGDGVDDNLDACPYNPTINNEGKDCNYVTDTDGNTIFEIWSAYDLKRLSEDSMKAGKIDKTGLPCSDLEYRQAECIDSDKMLICIDGENGYFWTEIDCDRGDVCKQDGTNPAQCVTPSPTTCNETETPSAVGDCCTQDFADTCKDSSTVLFCMDGMVTAYTCVGGCSIPAPTEDDPNPSLVCKDCLGDEMLTTGGNENACCDSANYTNSCSSDGSLLNCIDGRVTKTQCDYTCKDADEMHDEAYCIACNGDSITEGGEINQCCDAELYIPVCSSDGKLTSCLDGRVQKQDCLGSCQSVAIPLEDSETPLEIGMCLESPKATDTTIQAKLMQDINMADVIAMENTALGCAGKWTSLDLRQTHIDGNGKNIKFEADSKRCALTNPLFDNFFESSINNVTLDYDMKGNASSAFAQKVVRSSITHVSSLGNWDYGMSIFGETGTYSAVFAETAMDSLFNDVSYSGNIQVISGAFFGLAGALYHSYLLNAKATPKSYVCGGMICAAVAGGLLSNTDASIVKDLKVEISDIKFNAPAYSGDQVFIGGFEYISNYALVKDIDIQLSNARSNNLYTDSRLYGFAADISEYSIYDHIAVSLKNLDPGYLYGITGEANNLTDASVTISNANSHFIYGIANSINNSKNLSTSISDIKYQNDYEGSWVNIFGIGESLQNTTDAKSNLNNITLGNEDTAVYGIGYYISGSNIDITMNNIKANNIYGISNEYYTEDYENTNQFKSNLSNITANQFYPLFRELYGIKASSIDVKLSNIVASDNTALFAEHIYNSPIQISNLKYEADKIISGFTTFLETDQYVTNMALENIDLRIKYLQSSDYVLLFAITNNNNNNNVLSLRNSSFQFDYLQGENVDFFAFLGSSYLEDVSVYANVFTKEPEYTGFIYSTYNTYTNILLNHVVVSTNYNKFTTTDSNGKATDSTVDYTIPMIYTKDTPIDSAFDVTETYWLKRDDSQKASSYAELDNKFKPLDPENVTEFVTTINETYNSNKWEAREIIENGVTIKVPMVNPHAPIVE